MPKSAIPRKLKDSNTHKYKGVVVTGPEASPVREPSLKGQPTVVTHTCSPRTEGQSLVGQECRSDMTTWQFLGLQGLLKAFNKTTKAKITLQMLPPVPGSEFRLKHRSLWLLSNAIPGKVGLHAKILSNEN